MGLEQVPFGKGAAYLQPDMDVLRDIKDRFNVLITNHQEVSPGNYSRLQNWPHRFTFNITAQYWFLYATRINDTPATILINRDDKKHYSIQADFDPEFYEGTLISGELVGYHFICQDLLVYRNERDFYLKHDIIARLTKLRHIFMNKFREDPLLDCVVFAVRPYWKMQELKNLPRLLEHLKAFGVNRCRHIIFTPEKFNRFPNGLIYQIKPYELRLFSSKEYTDLTRPRELCVTRHHDSPDTYQVWDEDEHLGTAYIADMQTSSNLRAIFESETKLRFYCVFNKTFRKWQPISPSAQ